MKYKKHLVFIVVCLLLVSCQTTTSTPPAVTNTPDLEVFAPGSTPDWSNIPYIPDGNPLQVLDIYLSEEGSKPFPTILAIHGGGFSTGSKIYYEKIAGRLNELGYAVVSIDYRLTPRFSYPAQVEDAFCATAWLHGNHETYGFDNKNIIVMGDSAGGYLAAMLGTIEKPDLYLEDCPYPMPNSDWIRGTVVFYGFYDFLSLEGHSPNDIRDSLQPYWGADYNSLSPETLAEMSPMSWVDGSEPHFLLIHGTRDTVVPSWMSENFATVLQNAGVEVELVLLDAEHAFLLKPLTSPENLKSFEVIDSFLKTISYPK